MHTDWPSTIGYKILLEVRFEVIDVCLAQHCFFFPLPHVPLEFKILLPPAKKQKILACIREIQVHKHWTEVYSQKVLTAMILNAILNVHGISDCLWISLFISLFLLLHVTVTPSIIRPKSKGKKKGRIFLMWCGRIFPKHNLSWRKFAHLENLLFTLCECFVFL